MHNNGKDKTSVKEDLNRLNRAYAALKPDEPPQLLAFTRDFPDYPLPAVLKDKDQIP